MGRKRKNNRHLPEKVYLKHNAYYFVSKNKWHFLGHTIAQMYLALSKFSESELLPDSNMHSVFDRYMLEIAPNKSAATLRANCSEIKYLRAYFGKMRPCDITPVHIYGYQDKRSRSAPVSANREKALLSHVLSMAIKWGLLKVNPCRDVKRLTEERRDRYVTDDEFLAVRNIAQTRIQIIMDFAYLTGLRRADILKLKLSDLGENGIYSHINKTGKKIIIEWTEELRDVITRAKGIRNKLTSLYIFNTKYGNPYTPDGFSTIWQRLIKRALDEGIIKEAFRFHDLRRKAATDAEKESGREYARQLLGHATQTMTERYISGVRTVKPLKKSV